jgi:hypothetical protein
MLLLAICSAMAATAICCHQLREKPEQPDPFLAASEDFSDAELQAQLNDDARIIALTLFAEARGESQAGRRAVASVIWSRADGKPYSMADECWKSRQFSCWNGKDGEKLLYLQEDRLAPKERQVFDECMGLAKELISGQFKPTVNSSHYHKSTIKPLWAKGMVRVAVIGRHIFYRRA